MFPACAGMNRRCAITIRYTSYVPRVRGDEPIHVMNYVGTPECSPRARG